MPSDLLFKTIGGLHRTLFRASGGKLLNKGLGMPVLALTTTGRKSGQPRTSMLTSPLQVDDRIVIVASKGGDDRNPDWFLNLVANPTVEVEMRGAKRTMTAHVADAAERAELWPRIVEDHANYGGYQRKTEREIPVVVLGP
jgi:deazaflavin-dependent oxidoreductase (nitroreductase family)